MRNEYVLRCTHLPLERAREPALSTAPVGGAGFFRKYVLSETAGAEGCFY